MDNCKICVSRRDFLYQSLGGLVGLILASQFKSVFAQDTSAKKKARACILLWMAGGPSQLDTFDPKPGTNTGGPFKDFATPVPGIHISEYLPNVAKQMKHLAIIRSMTSKEGNHDRARYLVHTGYSPNPTVKCPSLGSIVASELWENSGDLPPFVSINGPSEGQGFFSVKYAPFVIQNPFNPVENLHPQGKFSEKLLDKRLALLNQMEDSFAKDRAEEEVKSHKEVYDRAIAMMKSPITQKVLNLGTEKESLREAYGKKSRFGQGCLMARKMIEAGVKFVEVVLPGWDTHKDNFNTNKKLMGELDPAFATLVSDLSERGMLEETLVICMGEFGRTPTINGNNGRDHYPKAWSVALAGGGIKGGKVIGATDAKGVEIKDKPYKVPDLFASIASAFGFDPTKKYTTPAGRPITLVDPEGAAIDELFS